MPGTVKVAELAMKLVQEHSRSDAGLWEFLPAQERFFPGAPSSEIRPRLGHLQQALRDHFTLEEEVIFVAFDHLGRSDATREVVATLSLDHQRILTDLEVLTGALQDTGAPPPEFWRLLKSLEARMEAHFQYEMEHVYAVLQHSSDFLKEVVMRAKDCGALNPAQGTGEFRGFQEVKCQDRDVRTIAVEYRGVNVSYRAVVSFRSVDFSSKTMFSWEFREWRNDGKVIHEASVPETIRKNFIRAANLAQSAVLADRPLESVHKSLPERYLVYPISILDTV